MALRLNDWILLKAMYDDELSTAILNKDEIGINAAITHSRYNEEINDTMFVIKEELDIERLHNEHLQILEDEETLNRML